MSEEAGKVNQGSEATVRSLYFILKWEAPERFQEGELYELIYVFKSHSGC